MKARQLVIAAVAAASALTGCGGGGSDSPVSAGLVVPPATSPPSTGVNPDLVTSVTPPTYAAGTTEKGAWDVLMAQRSACGFGLLQQDSRLDVASKAHTDYLVKNSLDRKVSVIGHGEDPTWTYFYGAGPDDRAARALFPTGVSENLDEFLSLQSASLPAPRTAGEALGASSMRTLIETVYHARGAFWAGRSGGTGASLATGPSATAGFNQTQFRMVAEVSNEADALKQKLGTGNLATWPCNGLTGVRGTFTPATEAPNPFPDVTSASTKYGTPIYFKVDPGSVLMITTATLTRPSDGSVLTTRMLNKSSDPTAQIGANEAFIVAITALAAGSSYTVNITGTVDGVAIARTFGFSTAP